MGLVSDFNRFGLLGLVRVLALILGVLGLMGNVYFSPFGVSPE